MHVKLIPIAALFHVEVVGPFHPTPVAHAIPRLGPRGEVAGVVVEALDELVPKACDFVQILGLAVLLDQLVQIAVGGEGGVVGIRLGSDARPERAIGIVQLVAYLFISIVGMIRFKKSRV